LFEIVKPEFLFGRPISERHRLAFYIGHLEAFDWNLLSVPLGLTSEDPALDTLFAFGIDPVDGQLPSDQPSDWPPLDEFYRYREQARAQLDAALDHVPLDQAALDQDALDADRAGRIDQLLHVAIEHRQMHAETLSYLLHQLPFDSKRGADAHSDPARRSPAPETVRIPAGKTMLGASISSGQFGWDNEFEAHAVDVPAFVIDQYKVTNRQYLAFLDDGGYARREFWSDADWTWKEANAIRHPAFWLRQDAQWFWRSMFRPVPLPPHWPVYVSHAEASAYARWAGRMLPTEAQWQRAAFGTSAKPTALGILRADGARNPHLHPSKLRFLRAADAQPAFARYGFAEVPFGADGVAASDDFAEPARRFDPFAVDAVDLIPPGPFPVAGMRGNGWEWTSTVFAPFAGFRRFDFYPGYSEPFFDGRHFVLKGGSVRTAASMLRPSFRNWFQPHYPYVYAGIRCVDRSRTS
jgi:ergothioneine biosynthesis protein EgtB